MTKTVEITYLKQREDRGGAIVANYKFVITDDLGNKKSGDGSVGIGRSTPNQPDQDIIVRQQVQGDIQRKIGFKGVTFVEPEVSPKMRFRA